MADIDCVGDSSPFECGGLLDSWMHFHPAGRYLMSSIISRYWTILTPGASKTTCQTRRLWLSCYLLWPEGTSDRTQGIWELLIEATELYKGRLANWSYIHRK